MNDETTPTNTTSTEDRDLLAAAIVRRNDIAAKVSDSRAALARAAALVKSLHSEMEQHEAALATHELNTAEALAAQLRQGTTLPNVDSTADAGNAERRAIQSRLNVAIHAHGQIESETKNLEGTLAHAVSVVRKHALAILRGEAEQVADSILQAEKDLWQRRILLRGIAFAEYKLAAMDGNKDRLDVPALLTVQSTRALQPAAEPQYAGGYDPAKDTSLKWQALYCALTEDAQAFLVVT